MLTANAITEKPNKIGAKADKYAVNMQEKVHNLQMRGQSAWGHGKYEQFLTKSHRAGIISPYYINKEGRGEYENHRQAYGL